MSHDSAIPGPNVSRAQPSGLGGGGRYALVKADAGRLPLESLSVDLCFGSPPYVDCRDYLECGRNLGIARSLTEWVEWMLAVTAECLRVTRGPVVWVAAGKTEGRNYWPACEGLMWEWYRRGGHAYRPVYWHRSGIPGNGGDDWFRADVEYVMCFKRPGKLAWSDNTAMGHAPVYGPGGSLSYRNKDGTRRDRWGGMPDKMTSRRGGDGTRYSKGQGRAVDCPVPAIANPGNLICTGSAGGGSLGHEIAHENEAPFPEDLAEFFVRSLCPPGGTTLDPFSGSGTTVSVALRLGRSAIGIDLRESQVRLARQRIERPHQPVVKAHRRTAGLGPLFAGIIPDEEIL